MCAQALQGPTGFGYSIAGKATGTTTERSQTVLPHSSLTQPLGSQSRTKTGKPTSAPASRMPR